MSKQSWRKVPYGTRPAKHAERKMLVEAFSRLDALAPMTSWRYVGLGSLWFTDFTLFHRRLGIHLLHSIEDEVDVGIRKRFLNNAPFDSKVHFGRTTSQLPQVPWDAPSIVWLDYDNTFQSYMLQDVDLIVGACADPTVVLFTMNVSPGSEDGRRERFVQQVGSEDRLPIWAKKDNDLDTDDLRQRGMSNAVRQIISEQITEALKERGDKELRYEQLFYFRYADGAQMVTFGGLISRASTAPCNFNDLPFHKPMSTPYYIEPPVLTLREGLALEATLPNLANAPKQLPGLTSKEVAAFEKLYRYLPSFVDADI